jgi:hypothetical protein
LFFFFALCSFFLSFFFSSFSPPSEGDIYKGQGGDLPYPCPVTPKGKAA